MNIFVTHPSPYLSAIYLPDKHIVKMPSECCQMLAIVAREYNYGIVKKVDGTPYQFTKGLRNHPCTQWALNEHNARWLIDHGLFLCQEYTYRYGKIHGSQKALEYCDSIFWDGSLDQVTNFVQCMPKEFKSDDPFLSYQRYIKSKGWTIDNYLRKPERKPSWLKGA